MPRISYFYGISIYMHYNDHAPGHFHAIYAGQEIQVRIDTLEFLEGSLPRRARRLVLEWARLHREELLENWTVGRETDDLKPIAPLE